MSPQDAVSVARPAVPIGERASLSLRDLPRLGLVGLQFGLIVLIVRAFEIESRAMLNVMLLAFGGFIVNVCLPKRLRMGFFALLSLASIAVVFGLLNAAWLIGLGYLLIALAHLPIAFGLRIALITFAAGVYAVARAGKFESGVPGAVWPILGAMFMFRLITYLYDLKHKAVALSPARATAYFFMMPNVCFPLFPVIDYKKFCLSHFNAEAFGIYQQGLVYMLRGVLHLLLYRFVYQNLLVDPASITDAGGAAQHVLALYLLYLRISGTFHLVVGLLHMFGFNLSETHHLYFLATSFTDYWRRINIYWKDYIQKLFFNPTYFVASRRMSAMAAMAVATGVAFFFTWLLHSYQWFWIRGTLDWRWQDAFFWSLLGVLVFVNMVFEIKQPKRQSLKPKPWTWAAEARRSLNTVLTFIVLAMCWLVWSTDSLGELRVVLSGFTHMSVLNALSIVGVLLVLFTASALLGRSKGIQTEIAVKAPKQVDADKRFWRSGISVALGSAVLLAVGTTPALLAFSPPLAETVSFLRHSRRLNQRDAQLLERGYYEDLTSVARFNTELAELYLERPEDWTRNDAIVQTGGYPPYELLPSKRVVFKNQTFTTNRHGFRDRDYELQKAPGTFRIAILGSSHALGEGVGDEETFENLVEDRLNREDLSAQIQKYEVLNFAVRGYGPLCSLTMLEKRVTAFQPDVVIYFGINDLAWAMREVGQAAAKGIEIPYEHVTQVAREAGLEKGMPRVLAESRLEPVAPALVVWIYERMIQTCAGIGAQPLISFLPRPEDRGAEAEQLALQLQLAERAHFTLLDTSDAYAGVGDMSSMWVSAYDRHPNAEGHRRLAEAFHAALLKRLQSDAQPGSTQDR